MRWQQKIFLHPKNKDRPSSPPGPNEKPTRRERLLPALLLAAILVFPGRAAAAEAPPESQSMENAALHETEQARRYAIPGGQSIGVLLSTDGVTVVGFSPVVQEDGSMTTPAEDAGLVVGDFITHINGEAVLCNEDVAAVVAKAGDAGAVCRVAYLRNGCTELTDMKPVFCQDTQTWRVGLYVRDNLCGVGTLTFYDSATRCFAALGHQVADIPETADDDALGTVVRASIQDIRAGKTGTPGEKIGVFLREDWQGRVSTNGVFGIYGEMNGPPAPSLTGSQLPVAFPWEVTSGPAQIYTVLDGETVESFDVNIVKTLESHKSSGHGLVLEITDQRLLEQCGGIVQGMSGSPILQNGRLVGAVTHVFVNDPTHGYGCFALWMLEEAEADRK